MKLQIITQYQNGIWTLSEIIQCNNWMLFVAAVEFGMEDCGM
jgi:hypothetical protein